jgi:hypothetical protein
MNEAKMKTRRRYAPSSSSRSLPSAPSQALRWPEWPCPMASTPMSCTSGAAGVSTCAGHPHRAASRRHQRVSDLAPGGGRAVRPVDARAAQVIRVDSLWLATEPMDMRAGVAADRKLPHIGAEVWRFCRQSLKPSAPLRRSSPPSDHPSVEQSSSLAVSRWRSARFHSGRFGRRAWCPTAGWLPGGGGWMGCLHSGQWMLLKHQRAKPIPVQDHPPVQPHRRSHDSGRIKFTGLF